MPFTTAKENKKRSTKDFLQITALKKHYGTSYDRFNLLRQDISPVKSANHQRNKMFFLHFVIINDN
jgi:hypothetical protein